MFWTNKGFDYLREEYNKERAAFVAFKAEVNERLDRLEVAPFAGWTASSIDKLFEDIEITQELKPKAKKTPKKKPKRK